MIRSNHDEIESITQVRLQTIIIEKTVKKVENREVLRTFTANRTDSCTLEIHLLLV